MLVEQIIYTQVDLAHLASKEYVIDHFPMPNPQDRAFSFVSSRANPHDDTQDDSEIPSTPLKEAIKTDTSVIGQLSIFTLLAARMEQWYYGDKIGLYFSFLKHHTKYLIFPALWGLIFQTVYWVDIKNIYEDYMTVFNAIFLSIWAPYWLNRWLKREEKIQMQWGRAGDGDTKLPEPIRMKFEGFMRKSPITGELDIYFSPSRSKFRILLAGGISLLICIIAIVLVVIVSSYRKVMSESGRFYLYGSDWSATIVSLINAAQMLLFNEIYARLGIILTRWENHRTYRTFQDSYAVKSALFRFANSYASLFYISFFKNLYDICPNMNCLNDVNNSLMILLIVNTAKNLIELGLPLVLLQIKKYKIKPFNQVGDLEKLLELEMSKNIYGLPILAYDGTIEEYLEVVTSFGFLVLFSVAFPFAGVLLFIASVFEIYVDRVKLQYLYRRPHPQPALNIGCWYAIFEGLNWMAVLTNSALLVWTARIQIAVDGRLLTRVPVPDTREAYHLSQEILSFVIYILLFIIIKIIITSDIFDFQSTSTIAGQRMAHLLQRLRHPLRVKHTTVAFDEVSTYKVKPPNNLIWIPSPSEKKIV
eukprot:GHVL01019410.1.p1 GENE.GHVL01019410.1~~GHVL01019410.1.p1  ORF type:complete len:589 (+),score=67.22 GHVL01019410.1:1143-2909(+)